VEDEYVLDAESLKMITVPELCVFKPNAGILKSSCLSSMRVHDIRELEFGIKPMPITHRGPNDAKNEPKTVTIAGIVDKIDEGFNDTISCVIAGKVPVTLAPKTVTPELSVITAFTFDIETWAWLGFVIPGIVNAMTAPARKEPELKATVNTD